MNRGVFPFTLFPLAVALSSGAGGCLLDFWNEEQYWSGEGKPLVSDVCLHLPVI